METFTQIFLPIHIISGIVSLILFWLPMASKKGGRLHVSSGKWYVYAMWVVVISAALLSIKNVIIANYSSAIFLGFLSILTGGPLWYAITIVYQKKGRTDRFRRQHFAYNLTLVLLAICMIIYGLTVVKGSNAILMYIFGGLGLSYTPQVLRFILGKGDQYNWIQEHVVGMITTGIAAYTAFFVFGGQNFMGNLFSGYWSIIPWVAPGVMGGMANFYYVRKYAQLS